MDPTTGERVEAWEWTCLNTTSTSHRATKTFAGQIGKNVVTGFTKPGDVDWLYILVDTTIGQYINIANMTVGGAAAVPVDDVSFIEHENGWVEWFVEYTSPNASQSVRIYPADSDGGNVYAGSDTTPAVYVNGFRAFKGRITDDTRYIKTVASTETGRHEYRHDNETLSEFRQRLGLLERLDEFGDPTGIFETPKDDTEYASPLRFLSPGAKCIKYNISSPVSSAWTPFSIQPATPPSEPIQTQLRYLSAFSSAWNSWEGSDTNSGADIHLIRVTSGNVLEYYAGSDVSQFKGMIHYI